MIDAPATEMKPDDYSEAVIESVLNQVSATLGEMSGEWSKLARNINAGTPYDATEDPVAIGLAIKMRRIVSLKETLQKRQVTTAYRPAKVATLVGLGLLIRAQLRIVDKINKGRFAEAQSPAILLMIHRAGIYFARARKQLAAASLKRSDVTLSA